MVHAPPPPQTRGYVTEEILRNEPEDGLERLQDALRVCRDYQSAYYDRRSNLAQYFKEGPVVEWSFQSSLVFGRLDCFMTRLNTIGVGPI